MHIIPRINGGGRQFILRYAAGVDGKSYVFEMTRHGSGAGFIDK
jgi:hypothetical protein